MKVLFLTPWYPDAENPNHGIFVRDQARTIAQNHDVWVICAKIDYTTFGIASLSREDTRFENLRESRIRVKRSLPYYNQFNFFFLIVKETLRIAREFNPQIIHGNIGYPGAFWSWCLSRLLGIPFVVTEHTRITNNFRSAIHEKLTLFGLRRAHKVIAVSEWHANEISQFLDEKPVVIQNVVNFEKYPGIAQPKESDEVQIGFLGNLNTNVKGLDILLKAMAGISEKFVLHIGGAGSLLEGYRQRARESGILEKCTFYGSIPHENVNSFMSRLHFFVSSSRFETFGIAMVEALACGLPVVATDSGGSREFITTENGLHIPVNDVEKLREGILTLMRTHGNYDREQIRRGVLAKFSPEVFLGKIEIVYESVIKRNTH